MEEVSSDGRVRKIRNECHNVLMAETQIRRHRLNGNFKVIQNNLKRTEPVNKNSQDDIDHNIKYGRSCSSDSRFNVTSRYSSILNVGKKPDNSQGDRRTLSQVFEKNTNYFSNRKRLFSEPSYTAHINEHNNMLLIKTSNVFENYCTGDVVETHSVNNRSISNIEQEHEVIGEAANCHHNVQDNRKIMGHFHLSQNYSNSSTGSTNEINALAANVNEENMCAGKSCFMCIVLNTFGY